MKSLIIYGSQYGTAKAYATKLSEITEIPCISYENIKDIKDYEQIIYFWGGWVVCRWCKRIKKHI